MNKSLMLCSKILILLCMANAFGFEIIPDGEVSLNGINIAFLAATFSALPSLANLSSTSTLLYINESFCDVRMIPEIEVPENSKIDGLILPRGGCSFTDKCLNVYQYMTQKNLNLNVILIASASSLFPMHGDLYKEHFSNSVFVASVGNVDWIQLRQASPHYIHEHSFTVTSHFPSIIGQSTDEESKSYTSMKACISKASHLTALGNHPVLIRRQIYHCLSLSLQETRGTNSSIVNDVQTALFTLSPYSIHNQNEYSDKSILADIQDIKLFLQQGTHFLTSCMTQHHYHTAQLVYDYLKREVTLLLSQMGVKRKDREGRGWNGHSPANNDNDDSDDVMDAITIISHIDNEAHQHTRRLFSQQLGRSLYTLYGLLEEITITLTHVCIEMGGTEGGNDSSGGGGGGWNECRALLRSVLTHRMRVQEHKVLRFGDCDYTFREASVLSIVADYTYNDSDDDDNRDGGRAVRKRSLSHMCHLYLMLHVLHLDDHQDHHETFTYEQFTSQCPSWMFTATSIVSLSKRNKLLSVPSMLLAQLLQSYGVDSIMEYIGYMRYSEIENTVVSKHKLKSSRHLMSSRTSVGGGSDRKTSVSVSYPYLTRYVDCLIYDWCGASSLRHRLQTFIKQVQSRDRDISYSTKPLTYDEEVVFDAMKESNPSIEHPDLVIRGGTIIDRESETKTRTEVFVQFLKDVHHLHGALAVYLDEKGAFSLSQLHTYITSMCHILLLRYTSLPILQLSTRKDKPSAHLMTLIDSKIAACLYERTFTSTPTVQSSQKDYQMRCEAQTMMLKRISHSEVMNIEDRHYTQAYKPARSGTSMLLKSQQQIALMKQEVAVLCADALRNEIHFTLTPASMMLGYEDEQGQQQWKAHGAYDDHGGQEEGSKAVFRESTLLQNACLADLYQLDPSVASSDNNNDEAEEEEEEEDGDYHDKEGGAGEKKARLKVGFLSSLLYEHSVGKLMHGIIRELALADHDIEVTVMLVESWNSKARRPYKHENGTTGGSVHNDGKYSRNHAALDKLKERWTDTIMHSLMLHSHRFFVLPFLTRQQHSKYNGEKKTAIHCLYCVVDGHCCDDLPTVGITDDSGSDQNPDSMGGSRREYKRLYRTLLHPHLSQSSWKDTRLLRSLSSFITALDLDVLIYPEIGMSTLPSLLAGRRLAPVQVAYWGHPIEQGAKEIDYFVSSELFENDVYSDINDGNGDGDNDDDGSGGGGVRIRVEQTVLFASLTTRFLAPPSPLVEHDYVTDQEVPFSLFTRLGIRSSEDVVYLLPHTIMKYSSSFDNTLAMLLHQDDQAILLVLWNDEQSLYCHHLKKRWLQAGIDISRILFIPRLASAEYTLLLRYSHVVLDVYPFNMGVTAMEAFSVGTPVVSMPRQQSVISIAAGMIRHMEMEWMEEVGGESSDTNTKGTVRDSEGTVDGIGNNEGEHSLTQLLLATTVKEYVSKAMRAARLFGGGGGAGSIYRRRLMVAAERSLFGPEGAEEWPAFVKRIAIDRE